MQGLYASRTGLRVILILLSMLLWTLTGCGGKVDETSEIAPTIVAEASAPGLQPIEGSTPLQLMVFNSSPDSSELPVSNIEEFASVSELESAVAAMDETILLAIQEDSAGNGIIQGEIYYDPALSSNPEEALDSVGLIQTEFEGSDDAAGSVNVNVTPCGTENCLISGEDAAAIAYLVSDADSQNTFLFYNGYTTLDQLQAGGTESVISALDTESSLAADPVIRLDTATEGGEVLTISQHFYLPSNDTPSLLNSLSNDAQILGVFIPGMAGQEQSFLYSDEMSESVGGINPTAWINIAPTNSTPVTSTISITNLHPLIIDPESVLGFRLPESEDIPSRWQIFYIGSDGNIASVSACDTCNVADWDDYRCAWGCFWGVQLQGCPVCGSVIEPVPDAGDPVPDATSPVPTIESLPEIFLTPLAPGISTTPFPEESPSP